MMVAYLVPALPEALRTAIARSELSSLRNVAAVVEGYDARSRPLARLVLHWLRTPSREEAAALERLVTRTVPLARGGTSWWVTAPR